MAAMDDLLPIGRFARMAGLGQLSTGREPLVSDTTTTEPVDVLDAAAHRRLGVELFNHTWTLI